MPISPADPLPRLRAALLALGFLLAAPLPAATVLTQIGGEVIAGDIVWVTATTVEVMPSGSSGIVSVPLGTLRPASAYVALATSRHLTGKPDAPSLVRQLVAWGLLDEAEFELAEEERLAGSYPALEQARMAVAEARAASDLAAARDALGLGRMLTAARLLDAVAGSSNSHSATAASLRDQHSGAIAQAEATARAAREARRATRRAQEAAERLGRLRDRAEQALAEADALVDSLLPRATIGEARSVLLAAAARILHIANQAALATKDLSAEAPERAELEDLWRRASSRLADVYAELADRYMVRGNAIAAYDWAATALRTDPNHARAEAVRRTARESGGAGGGGWPLGGARNRRVPAPVWDNAPLGGE